MSRDDDLVVGAGGRPCCGTDVGGHGYDGGTENAGRSVHVHANGNEQDGSDCGCDFSHDFSRISRVQRRRFGLGCTQDCRGRTVQVSCNRSKVCLGTGTMIQPFEVAERGSKSVRDDARGWRGRSRP